VSLVVLVGAAQRIVVAACRAWQFPQSADDAECWDTATPILAYVLDALERLQPRLDTWFITCVAVLAAARCANGAPV
jgi:hypothetical protein